MTTRHLHRPAALVGLACTLALVAGCTASTRGSGSTHSAGSSGSTATNGSTPTTCSTLNGMDPEVTRLTQTLTTALETHNRTAFVTAASTAAAKQAMGLWWDNAAAIGIDGGLIYHPTDADESSSQANLTALTLQVGVRSPLDPVDSEKERNVPSTQYKVGVARTAKCGVSITSWHSLSNTPLDVPEHLYVVHHAHTVVAGVPSMRTSVDRVAGLAEKAAQWELQFWKVEQDRHDYIDQTGFVTFVPDGNAQANAWFRAPTAKRPNGWIGDAGNVAGYTFPMPGVNAVGVQTRNKYAMGAPGGARVTINPLGLRDSNIALESVLVHEFAHDLLSDHDIGYWLGGHGVSAATVEGTATWIQGYFLNRPSCFCKRAGQWPSAYPYLKPRATAYRFPGHVPTDAEVYGTRDPRKADFYYNLSAMTFDWLARQYGAPFALQSAVDSYTNGGSPFSGVISKIKGGSISFADPGRTAAQWVRYVRSGMPR